MSVDAKDFDIPAGIVPLGSTDATLTFSTKGDTYLVQSFAFSVPIPDELITQSPVPAEVGPGQTIDYGIAVDNGVDVAEHDAEFTVHLAPVLTDAVYEGARRRPARSLPGTGPGSERLVAPRPAGDDPHQGKDHHGSSG